MYPVEHLKKYDNIGIPEYWIHSQIGMHIYYLLWDTLIDIIFLLCLVLFFLAMVI